MFLENVRLELNKGTQLTENGAVGFSTSGRKLLDVNFRVSSYRNLTEDKIFADFMDAYAENPMLAMRWLFYARDVRGGLGERRLFRAILNGLVGVEPEVTKKILPLIAMFGRWDDLFTLIGTNIEVSVLLLIQQQLSLDIDNFNKGKSVSLLAKWMPSINCSNIERKNLAKKIILFFGIDEKTYRRVLSILRTHLDVVEKKMSANQWSAIEYAGVSSRANLVYNSAFLKHDEMRRRQFLSAVEKGETKINSGTNFPHDILAKYNGSRIKDEGIEMLWKALPNYGNLENTLVVADGSGSMSMMTIGNTKILPLDVANSLAIYFAEHCEGGFKNKYITFSSRPQLVDLGTGSLLSKKIIAQKYCEAANTNIQAVFELILNTAINGRMKQSELPSTVLVLSDMEFDGCIYGRRPDKTLFAQLAMKYAEHGYKLPKLAFWNIMSRTMTVPVQRNEAGVSLISGFSPSAIKMVLNGKTDPYDALIEVLKDPKYDIVEETLTK